MTLIESEKLAFLLEQLKQTGGEGSFLEVMFGGEGFFSLEVPGQRLLNFVFPRPLPLVNIAQPLNTIEWSTRDVTRQK